MRGKHKTRGRGGEDRNSLRGWTLLVFVLGEGTWSWAWLVVVGETAVNGP
jgi:hypothetical protein